MKKQEKNEKTKSKQKVRNGNGKISEVLDINKRKFKKKSGKNIKQSKYEKKIWNKENWKFERIKTIEKKEKIKK